MRTVRVLVTTVVLHNRSIHNIAEVFVHFYGNRVRDSDEQIHKIAVKPVAAWKGNRRAVKSSAQAEGSIWCRPVHFDLACAEAG